MRPRVRKLAVSLVIIGALGLVGLIASAAFALPPGIVTVSPGVAANTAPVTITVTGTSMGTVTSMALHKGNLSIPGTGLQTTATTARGDFDITNTAPGGWDVLVTNPDGTTTRTNGFTVTASAPTISSIAPNSRGQGATNQNIIITGTNFFPGVTVSFTPSTGITINSTTRDSTTQITVNIDVASTAPTGARTLAVQNTDLQQASKPFTINAAPTVTSANPTSRGQGASNQSVVITGTGFTGAPSVNLGAGVTVPTVVLNLPTKLTATVNVASGAATGARAITVTNGDGGTASSTCNVVLNTGCFTVNPKPTAISAAPNSLAQGASNQNVVIGGSNFQPGLNVQFSGAGIHVNTVTLDGITGVLTANISIDLTAAPGARDITVTNPDGATPAVCSGCFTVTTAPPTTAAASPNSRGQGATNQNITLTGANYAGTPTVSFSGGGITVNSVVRNSATQLLVNISVDAAALPNARNITVTNPDAKSGTCTACFTVNPAPTVNAVNPPSAPNTGTTTLSLVGTGFDNSSGSALLHKTGQPDVLGTNYTRVSATQVNAKFNLAGIAPGAWDVRLVNGDAGGPAVCTSCFTATAAAPAITSVTPASRGQGATNQNIIIAGTNYFPTPTVTFTQGNGIIINSVSRNSSSQITVNIDVLASALPVPSSVTVRNTDNQAATCAGCFTVNAAPTLTSVTPAAATNSGPVNLTLNGSNFQDTGSVVLRKSGQTDIPGTSWHKVDATHVTATFNITDAQPGSWSLRLFNGDAGGPADCNNCFVIGAQAPTVSGAAPSSLGQGAQNQNVVITGTRFFPGATASFSGSGITVVQTDWTDNTHVTAKVNIDPGATTGTRTITVTNSDGQSGTCPGSCFTVNPPPTVTATSPDSLGQGATAIPVGITGTGFDAAPTVAFSGAGITTGTVTRDSDTHFTVPVTVAPTATPNARTITVTNSDGGTSGVCVCTFTVNPAPTVTSISPTSAPNTGSGSFTITGTGFDDSSGSALLRRAGQTDVAGTNYARVSATQVTATFDPTGISPGAWDVVLTNGDHGGPATCTGCLTITAAAPTISSVSPASLTRGASNKNVVITGTNFFPGADVTFNPATAITVNSVTRNSPTQVTANVSIANAASTGARTLSVTNTDAQSADAPFTIDPKPIVTFTTPTSLTGPVVASFNRDVSGATTSNFVLRLTGTTTNVASASVVCRDMAATQVNCTIGAVRTAVLFMSSPLTSGQHYTAYINPAGSPTLIRDGSGVAVPATQSSDFRGSLVEQENSPGAAYKWGTVASRSTWGGSYTRERLAGGTATIAFTGSSISWYTVIGPDQGIATIIVDGVSRGNVSNFANRFHYNVVRTIGGLTAGAHKLTLVVTGQKGAPKALNTFVSLDAVKGGAGSLQKTAVATYTWRSGPNAAASGGRYAYTDQAGAEVSFKFRGTGLDWYTSFGINGGRAAVYVDGKQLGVVDTYKSSSSFGRIWVRNLADSVHTLRIVVLGQRSAASRGTTVAVDRFVVL